MIKTNILLFSSLYLLSISHASACRCIEPEIATAYKNSVAVVQVTAEEVINVPEGSGITAILNVSKSWKTNTASKIAVNSLTSCYFPMKKDKGYILFLNIEPNGLYSTGRCAGNKTSDNSDELLKWLNINTRKIK